MLSVVVRQRGVVLQLGRPPLPRQAFDENLHRRRHLSAKRPDSTSISANKNLFLASERS